MLEPGTGYIGPTRVEAIHAAEIAVCYLPSPLNKLEKTEKLFWVF